MSEFVITRSDELYHHGIKGQKWGVRRYQNDDGSYTAEGYKRYYGERFEKESKKQQKLNYNADQKTQIKIAEDSRLKAKKNALIGLGGVGAAAAGYGLLKSIPDPLSVNRIRTYDASTGKTFTYIQDAAKLIPGIAGASGIVVGAPTALVGFGKAAYDGIKSAVASHRASIVGHNKAAKKAKDHLEGMREMFANTPYAALVEERFGR